MEKSENKELVTLKREMELVQDSDVVYAIEELAHFVRDFYELCGKDAYPQTILQAATGAYQALMQLAFAHHLFEDEIAYTQQKASK